MFHEMLRQTVNEASQTRREIYAALRLKHVTFPADQTPVMQLAQTQMNIACHDGSDIQDRIEAASTAWSMYSDVLAVVYQAADAAMEAEAASLGIRLS
jgi:hypothetical protein